ncbi:MAG TPA: hypothetical protein VIY56_08845, partial [Vicinamibacterales bacterium]
SKTAARATSTTDATGRSWVNRAEWFDYEGKRYRARSVGVQAWLNAEEYRRFVARQKRAFEDQVDLELAAGQ